MGAESVEAVLSGVLSEDSPESQRVQIGLEVEFLVLDVVSHAKECSRFLELFDLFLVRCV